MWACRKKKRLEARGWPGSLIDVYALLVDVHVDVHAVLNDEILFVDIDALLNDEIITNLSSLASSL
jgi:hypothetical protein